MFVSSFGAVGPSPIANFTLHIGSSPSQESTNAAWPASRNVRARIAWPAKCGSSPASGATKSVTGTCDARYFATFSRRHCRPARNRRSARMASMAAARAWTRRATARTIRRKPTVPMDLIRAIDRFGKSSLNHRQLERLSPLDVAGRLASKQAPEVLGFQSIARTDRSHILHRKGLSLGDVGDGVERAPIGECAHLRALRTKARPAGSALHLARFTNQLCQFGRLERE